MTKSHLVWRWVPLDGTDRKNLSNKETHGQNPNDEGESTITTAKVDYSLHREQYRQNPWAGST